MSNALPSCGSFLIEKIMGWKIIEIEKGESLQLFLNNLVIYRNDERITIPLVDIDVLLINNFLLKITIQLLNALSQNNIIVIICDNNYLPCSNVVPIIGNYNTLKILNAQLSWDNDFKSNLWNKIIYQKITNQSSLIENLKIGEDACDKIRELRENIEYYDLTNREGHASKIYWHSLFGKNFKRHNEDYTNSLLNYGYAILRSYFCRSIIKKGLDPRISVFHKSFHNYFALASDLMEPFRSLIDKEVYKMIQENVKDFYLHKQRLIEVFNEKICINGKLQYVNNAIDIFIDSIIANENFPNMSINDEAL